MKLYMMNLVVIVPTHPIEDFGKYDDLGSFIFWPLKKDLGIYSLKILVKYSDFTPIGSLTQGISVVSPDMFNYVCPLGNYNQCLPKINSVSTTGEMNVTFPL